jgi:hypothetical protein
MQAPNRRRQLTAEKRLPAYGSLHVNYSITAGRLARAERGEPFERVYNESSREFVACWFLKHNVLEWCTRESVETSANVNVLALSLFY